MTEKLQLVTGYDFTADSGTVSLLSNTDGFDVAYEGWKPAQEIEKDGLIREALTLRIQGTSTDHLAASLQKLAAARWTVQEFIEQNAANKALWFRVQIEGETGIRQSLVRGLDYEPASSIYDYALRQKYHWNKFTLGIERSPWWESTTMGTIVSGSISILGGTFAYSGVDGDLPARIAKIVVDPDIDSQGTVGYGPELFPWGQFWLGFRSDRYGTPSAWTPYKGVYVAGRGSGTADTTAHAGSASIGGGYLKMSEIAAAPQNMEGKFLVLARVKIGQMPTSTQIGAGSAVQFNIRMKTSFYTDSYGSSSEINSNARYYPRIPISVTTGFPDGSGKGYYYHIYEMGEITYPPNRSGMANASNFMLSFGGDRIYDQAAGTAGTPQLYWDTIYLIPTGEGYYWGGRPLGAKYDNEYNYEENNYYGFNGPDDVQAGLTSGTVDGSGNILMYGASQPFVYRGVPPGSGIGVFVCDDVGYRGFDVLPWKVDVTLNTVERWESLRGAE